MIRKIINKTRKALGLNSLYKKIYIFINRDYFDIINGTDTAMPIIDDALYAENDGMNYYVASLTASITSSLQALINYDRTVTKSTFFDLGSGKGKVLILAERHGFRDVIGIEISQVLNDVCMRNLKKTKSKHVKLWKKNAENIDIPNTPCVFFLYNSFSGELLKSVLKNIERSFTEYPRDGYLIYVDPKNLSNKEPIVLDCDKYETIYSDTRRFNPYNIYKLRVNVNK